MKGNGNTATYLRRKWRNVKREAFNENEAINS